MPSHRILSLRRMQYKHLGPIAHYQGCWGGKIFFTYPRGDKSFFYLPEGGQPFFTHIIYYKLNMFNITYQYHYIGQVNIIYDCNSLLTLTFIFIDRVGSTWFLIFHSNITNSQFCGWYLVTTYVLTYV